MGSPIFLLCSVNDWGIPFVSWRVCMKHSEVFPKLKKMMTGGSPILCAKVWYDMMCNYLAICPQLWYVHDITWMWLTV